MGKKNSLPLRADPEFAQRVIKIMEEDQISQRAATRKIEKQLKDMELRLRNNVRF